jgi:hypothetical protein
MMPDSFECVYNVFSSLGRQAIFLSSAEGTEMRKNQKVSGGMVTLRSRPSGRRKMDVEENRSKL